MKFEKDKRRNSRAVSNKALEYMPSDSAKRVIASLTFIKEFLLMFVTSNL